MDTIEIITIPVRDQQESKAFYQNIGFEVVVEAPMGKDSHWIQMKLPGATPSISLVKSFPYPEIAMEPGALQGLVLKTHDMNAFVKRLGEHNIPYGVLTESGFRQGEISQTAWGQFTHFNDPDGNGLSVHQE